MPQDSFTAQLIAAIEEAQAAASQPKPQHKLAQTAYERLQFDFPVVSETELAALVDEYSSGKRRGVTARFLAVLRENAGSAAAGGGDASTGSSSEAEGVASAAAASSGGSSQGLVPLYQQLYAVAVLQTLQSCLEVPEAAAAQLSDLAPAAATGGSSFFGAEGSSQLEAALATAAAEQQGAAGDRSELEHRLSQQEDDDSFAYEPLEAAAPAMQPMQQLQPAAAQPASGDAAAALPAQLAALAGHLSYHCMSEASAWRELRLMQRLAACLAVLRRHPSLSDQAPVAQPLLRLAVDRCVAVPAELEAGLPALLDALGATADSSSSSGGGRAAASQQGTPADTAAAELAIEAAVALAAQVTAPSARRRLWQETHQRLLPLAAQQLEQQQVQLARQARAAAGKTADAAGGAAGTAGTAGAAQPSALQLYSIMLACQLLYFFVLHAPPGFAAAAAAATASASSSSGGRLQEAFLRGGLLRSLVLLYMQLGAQPGAEPLRCALLLACAAAQPLADWAVAVPGFKAAVGAPELGPGGAAQLHGALWSLLLGSGGGALAALLRDATPADKVPAIFQALQLMADLQAVARRPLWDAEVAAALRQLGDTLRQQYSKPRDEAEAAGAGEGSRQAPAGVGKDAHAEAEQGAVDSLDNRADAAKLAVGAEEQAVRLAARHAQQLQPACLKLVKDLLQRDGGSGKQD